MRLPPLRRWLAGSAALAGALAPLVGSPYRGGRATVDVAELTDLVEREQDHVSAVELAGWLRARRPGLRVFDVRSAAEFAVYHIPGAEHVPLSALTRTRVDPDDTVVLYSEAGPHGAQAWVFLRALGNRRVFFLRRGLHEWLDDVMSRAVAAPAPSGPSAPRGRGC